MWKFEKYTREDTVIPEQVIMSMRTGLEARYADRFRGYAGTTDESLKSADDARKTADSLRTAAGVVDAQKENVDDLFVTAELIVTMINDFQRESGVKQIRNVPLANEAIKSSHGKKLGYVKMSMQFVSSGLLHFMDMTLQMREDLKTKDRIIQSIADNRVEVPILGRLTEIDLDDLSSDDPIIETKVPLEVGTIEEPMTKEAPPPTSQAPITPPKTPQPNKKGPSPSTPTPSKNAKR